MKPDLNSLGAVIFIICIVIITLAQMHQAWGTL